MAFKRLLGSCATLGLVAVLLMSGACSNSQKIERREGGFARVFSPRPPRFLTGPASVLLTNTTGFSALLEVQTEASFERQGNYSGQLLVRGSKLLFAPASREESQKQPQAGGYSYLWDMAENRGYVLSEALQGYAPVSTEVRVTNVLVEIGKSAAQRLAGHPCEAAEATLLQTDGTTARFDLLKAVDLNGLPLRIQANASLPALTLTLSRVHLEVPPAEVFAPPDGFAKYATPEAMADELAARQHNLRKKNTDTPLEMLDYSRRQ